MPGSPVFLGKNNLKIGLKTAFCDGLRIFTNFNRGSCAIFVEDRLPKAILLCYLCRAPEGGETRRQGADAERGSFPKRTTCAAKLLTFWSTFQQFSDFFTL